MKFGLFGGATRRGETGDSTAIPVTPEQIAAAVTVLPWHNPVLLAE